MSLKDCATQNYCQYRTEYYIVKTMKHAGGRPTKYRIEFNQELDRYLQTTGREMQSLPTMQGFCLWLGVDDDTLIEWAKRYKEFSATIKRLKKLQAKQLIDDGIYGGKEVNSTIVKLLLQNNHGMKERQDFTTNDKDLPTPIYNGQSTK